MPVTSNRTYQYLPEDEVLQVQTFRNGTLTCCKRLFIPKEDLAQVLHALAQHYFIMLDLLDLPEPKHD